MWRPVTEYGQSKERGALVIAKNQVAGLVAAAVLIAASFTVALLIGRDTTHHSPETVVRDYLIAVYEAGNASQYLSLVDPQDLEEVEAEYGIDIDEVREALQDSLDDFHRELGSGGVSLSWVVGNTTAQNMTAETAVTVTFSHPEYGDDEYTETITTVERDGRWYLGTELLEAFLQWFLWSPQ